MSLRPPVACASSDIPGYDGPGTVDEDAVYEHVRRLGGEPRHHALPGAGRVRHRDRRGREPDPEHTDRNRQVARRRRRALRRARPGRAHVLHGADQGARLREVLRAGRDLRRRERRDDDRRLRGQRRRPDHLLHRGDPRQPRPPARRGHPGRPGRDGRVPLLRRPRPRLGVAGAAAHAAARAVHPDVGDARRRDRARRRPHAGARAARRPS